MKSKATFPRYLAIILICLLCLCPFVVLLILSLNEPGSNMYDGNVLIPDFYFGNYAEGWAKSNIGRAMINSGIITLTALLLIVFLGAMAGYAVARYPNKFNRMVFNIMLCCMMIPGIINTVPLYTLMIKIKAVNTLWGMACVCATLALPQAVFVFSGFIRALPRELEEAAVIDGCTPFMAFWRIVFPLLMPSISAVVILNGFGIWNNYSQAVFFLQSSAKHNVPQALSVYFQQFAGAKWNLMAATAVIAIVPVVVIFLIFQKSLMKGLTEGAIKG
ncbi:MAG: carbohydrate ABC transporter permease [Blautia massiliensis (ex Durand et al. 2017)]|mgnify:FL=1|jgi:raffinose/stachyose/melibiose transport system permease protein|uniref:carbohydrate ABC transporter permease n=1 Tax=Gemmiger formicilis TaxID=745368 RepID=UPI00261174A9|nr:carbohydrate ABC transporter permease [uncultured Subdoligranulum sp.]